MSLPTLTALLLAGCMSGVRPAPTPLSSSPSPKCSPLCLHGHCMPISVQKLDESYCVCGRMSSNWATHTFSVKQKENNTILIRWKRKILPNEPALLYLPVGDSGICFNITPQEVTWDRHMKVVCTHSDQINMADNMFRLLKLDSYQPVAISKDNKGKNRMMRQTPQPPCLIPDTVTIRQINSTRLEVSWFPFRSGRDIRVLLLREGSDVNDQDKMARVPIWPICRDHITSWTFNNVTPGAYKAKVGFASCDNIIFRQSDVFQLQDPYTSTITEVSTTPSRPDPDPPVHLLRATVYVVGVLAFICCTSLGIACLIRQKTFDWSPRSYKMVYPGYAQYSTKITIVGNTKDEETAAVMSWIKSSLKQPNVEIDTATDLTSIAQDEKHLLVVVSLQNVHTFSEPLVEEWAQNMSITILANYGSAVCSKNRVCSLLAHIPAGILHPCFDGVQNNEKTCSRIVDIKEVMKRLNPGFKPHSAEVEHFLEKVQELRDFKRNKMRRIFLMSSSDHPRHVAACLELTKVIRCLGKEVTCNLQEANMEAMEECASEWTTNLINSSDLVLVVCSRGLYKMAESFGDLDLSADLQTEASCVSTSIDVLSKHDCEPNVVFLTFGYAAGYVKKLQELKPIFKYDEVYDLVDTTCSHVDGHDADDFKRSSSAALEHFLLTLTSDESRVQKAISNSGLFFQRVEEMAAMIEPDLKYDSTEALVTSSSISDWPDYETAYETYLGKDVPL